MLRTQISLTDAERQILDRLSARTGLSMSALIRDAVHIAYDQERSADDDLAAMRAAKGCWSDRGQDSADWVDSIRSGHRFVRAR